MNKLRIIKWLGITAALLLVVACFMPWVYIESLQQTITGMDSGTTSYGKPGYFHLLMVIAFLACVVIPKLGAKRFNLLIVALNIGWAIRNMLIIPSCAGGECPVKKAGLFLMLVCSVMMLVAALFPDMELEEK